MTHILLYWNHICVLHRQEKAFLQELAGRLRPDVGVRRLVNLLTGWRHEIEEMLGGMGINSIESLRGNRLMLRGVGLNEKELELLGVKHAGE